MLRYGNQGLFYQVCAQSAGFVVQSALGVVPVKPITSIPLCNQIYLTGCVFIGMLWLASCQINGFGVASTADAMDPITLSPTPTEAYLLVTPVPTVRFSALPTSVGYSPQSLPENINPLTGLPVNDPNLLDRRPMAVKVTNFPRYARPQFGLTRADVVFEYYIEDYLTRFTAVYYGNDVEQVGPVRSGRFFDEHILRMYHSYLIFKGADKRVFEYWKESPDLHPFLIVAGSGTCPWYCVVSTGHDSYNSYFFNTRLFQGYLERTDKDNTRQNLRASYFFSEPAFSSRRGERIYTRFSPDSYNYWDYNAELGYYRRYQEVESARDGVPETYAPLMDALTDEQVTAENIIVLFASYTFADIWQEEDEVFHVELNGSGQAFLFREGDMFEALWHRTDRDQPLLLTDLSGDPLPLKPGRTFYEVIGSSSIYTQEQTVWNFQHNIP